MDLAAALAFLDSDSEDDEAPIPLPFPPLLVPNFFEEDDEDTDNMILLFGMAEYYLASIKSGVRESERYVRSNERVWKFKRQWLRDCSAQGCTERREEQFAIFCTRNFKSTWFERAGMIQPSDEIVLDHSHAFFVVLLGTHFFTL